MEVQHGKLRQGDSKLSRIPDSRISKSSWAIKQSELKKKKSCLKIKGLFIQAHSPFCAISPNSYIHIIAFNTRRMFYLLILI